MSKLAGKTALVTGASAGIGLATARLLSEAGVRLIGCARRLEVLCTQMGELPGPTLSVQLDVADTESVAGLMAQLPPEWQTIDILVNNAAIFHGMRYETLLDVDMDYYYQIMKVNMHSPLVMTRAVAASMVQRGGGSVINQSSTAAWKAQGGYYGVAKLGVQGLTMCLASELGDRNIRVNAIAPGPTDTEATRQVPAEILDHVVNGLALKRLGETLDVVNLAKVLACDEAARITWQTFRVDGGDTLLPA